MAAVQNVRIRLKSYDHTLVEQAAEKIVDVAKGVEEKTLMTLSSESRATATSEKTAV